jgi:hypothetical protein
MQIAKGYNPVMDRYWTTFIVTLVFLLPIMFFFLRVLYTQVQAHIIEFFLTLVVSTLPMGVLLAIGKKAADDPWSGLYLPKVLTLGLFPMMLIFAGSLWGLSAARRLGEERTWPRLGLLFLGWTFTPGGICAVVVPVVEILEQLDHHGMAVLSQPWRWWVCHVAAFMLPGIIPVIAAIRVERRCRRPSRPTTFP